MTLNYDIPKSIKIKAKYGNISYDSSWIAGVLYSDFTTDYNEGYDDNHTSFSHLNESDEIDPDEIEESLQENVANNLSDSSVGNRTKVT